MEKQTCPNEQDMHRDPPRKEEPAAISGRLFNADLMSRAESGELSVEEAFAALGQIVQRMEEESISLEDSFDCYETGIRLVRYCSERIDRVEKKVRMLRGEGEAPLEDA